MSQAQDLEIGTIKTKRVDGEVKPPPEQVPDRLSMITYSILISMVPALRIPVKIIKLLALLDAITKVR